MVKNVFAEAQKEMAHLLEFICEDNHLDKNSDFYDKDDENAPFFSEAYLYNLLGKEDARSLLARMRKVCKAIGMTETQIREL